MVHKTDSFIPNGLETLKSLSKVFLLLLLFTYRKRCFHCGHYSSLDPEFFHNQGTDEWPLTLAPKLVRDRFAIQRNPVRLANYVMMMGFIKNPETMTGL